MILFMLGGPGSGKTTLSKAIAAKHELFQYVGGGDIARKLAEENKEAREALEIGGIIPPHLMDTRMIMAVSEAESRSKHVIVDGYPRYFEQLTDVLTVFPMHKMAFCVTIVTNLIALERCGERGRFDDTDEGLAARLRHWDTEGIRMINYVTSRSAGMIKILEGSRPLRDNLYFLELFASFWK